MRPFLYSVGTICLLVAVAHVFAAPEEPSKLPNQYAEIVLHVEGMI